MGKTVSDNTGSAKQDISFAVTDKSTIFIGKESSHVAPLRRLGVTCRAGEPSLVLWILEFSTQ